MVVGLLPEIAMSLRPSAARPALRPSPPDTNFTLSLGRGASLRRLTLSPLAFYSVALLIPLLGTLYLGATAYMFFRDDMISALMTRHARQQYAYEDRLAALRLQIDRMAGRQMLDQDSFDGKLRDMIARQARIETRAAVLASLGDVLGPGAINTQAQTAVPRTPRPSDPPSWTRTRPIPTPLDASIPVDNPESASTRPRPDDTGLRPSADASDVLTPRSAVGLTLADATSDEIPASLRLGVLSTDIDRAERVQVATLRRLEGPAVTLANKLRAAIEATGLSPTRLKLASTEKQSSAVGGPYIPLRIDANASEFDAQLARTQTAILSVDALRRTIPLVPLAKPLSGVLDQTSRFGYRLDPFLGRPALHSGIDFRGEYGAPVRATAEGKVVTAGPTGGYGNMVEIDHGNGLSTRYGHLSAISVGEGQTVVVGGIIGRVGSTGRSTGNHLHYEVRIDDEAVDPARFIKAATLLAQD